MKKSLLILALLTASPFAFASSSQNLPVTKPAVIARAAAKAPIGDLSKYRKLAVEVLALAKAGKLAAAKTKVKELETAWDSGQSKMESMNAKIWRTVDIEVDNVLNELRADKPQVASSVKALEDLIKIMDKSK